MLDRRNPPRYILVKAKVNFNYSGRGVIRKPSKYRTTQSNQHKQVIARDDMPAPIAADLGPCADGSAVRTALAAWPRRCALAGLGAVHLGQVGDTDGQTDGRTDRGIG